VTGVRVHHFSRPLREVGIFDRVERALLPAAFDVDFAFEREDSGFNRFHGKGRHSDPCAKPARNKKGHDSAP
jgi:hypothetical protein